MNKNNQSMCLENLPDEIFLEEIFSLFSWKELYHSFFGLNQRLHNLILCSKHLGFTVDNTSICYPPLTFFTPCIARLTVCLGQFDITSFSNLRSLTLQYPSLQQRNSIRPENFPLLKYLELSYPLEDSILLNFIFSNGFKHLETCRFDRTLTDHSWNGSPKFRSLSISVYDSYGTICVLRACPNILRLNIIVYDIPQKNLSLPRHPISCMNLFLRHLFIRSKFEILAAILSCMPNLKWLTFDDMTGHGDQNPGFTLELLADILSMLGQLSYLRFRIETLVWDGGTPLHRLHKLFKYAILDGTTLVIASDPIAKSR